MATDLNGDGKRDIVAGQLNGLNVLLGNGDGTFQAAVLYGAGEIQSVAAADFNGDGRMDLAAANETTDTVDIFLGNGDGTLRPPVKYPVDSRPTSIVAADFNRDGTFDLATGNLATGLAGSVNLLHRGRKIWHCNQLLRREVR
ncbi:MAG: VCBS repeat-containing protein [Acidobacteriales bacterium]|nr:VCBS repeat-containing protein [Terriglobales bacterium]